LSAEEITSAVDDNLRNLRVDALDVVKPARHVARLVPTEGSIEAPLSALVKQQRAGKVRHIGLSNVTAKQVEEGRSMTEIVCVQNLYNLAHRGDDPLADGLAAAGIAYVPFFPLGGFSPLQSTTLSDCREGSPADADASRTRVAPSASDEQSSDSRHVERRSISREYRGCGARAAHRRREGAGADLDEPRR